MLYQIGWDLTDLVYILFAAGIVCTVFFLRFCVKRIKSAPNNRMYLFPVVMLLFLIIALITVTGWGIGTKLYGISVYNNKGYETAEGTVEDFEYIYAKNSRIVRAVRFSVNDVDFMVDAGRLNAGYSYGESPDIKNGDSLRLHYVKPVYGAEAGFILGIESAEVQ